MLRDPRARDGVPDSACQPESYLRSAWAVMKQVVLFDVPEVGTPEVVEVDGMMHPLFQDVSEHQGGDEHGRARERPDEKGEPHEHGPGNERVLQRSVHMVPVPRPGVMREMEMIELSMQEVANPGNPWEEGKALRQPPSRRKEDRPRGSS